MNCKWFGIVFLNLIALFVMNGICFGQTGYIKVTSSPINASFSLFNDDSSYVKNTTANLNLYWSVPANHTYTLKWLSQNGYDTPSSTTAYVMADDSIIFNGIYIPSGAPNVPSNLTATSVNYVQINLNWQDNSSNETGFIVERGLASDSIFSVITTTGANATNLQDTSVAPQTAYVYEVRATNDAGTSAPSNVAIATTTPYPPSLPVVNFTSSVTSLFAGIRVQFTDNSLYEESLQWNFGDGIGISYRQSTSYSYSNTTSAVYVVQDIVTNVLGSSTGEETLYVGGIPSNLTVTPISGPPYGFHLSWQDNSDNEIGFQVYNKMAPDPISLETASFSFVTTVPQNQTTYDDYGLDTSVGLDSSQQYAYEIRAVSTDTVSSFITYQPDFAVAEFYSLPSSGYSPFGQMSVQFFDLSSNATTWYWDFGDGGNFNGQNPGIHVYISSTNAIFYASESVNNGLGFGNIFTKAVFLNIPPSNLSAATTGPNQALVSWEDNSLYEIGIEVDRQVNSGGFSLYTSLPAQTSNFTDMNLAGNSEYDYRVRSTTYQAVSDYTNVATIQTGSVAVTDWSRYSENQFLDQDLLDSPKAVLESYPRK